MNILLALAIVGGTTLGAVGDLQASQATELVVPETITIRFTGQDRCYTGIPYRIVEMDFKEYVKGVLPAEWGNNWHEESLKAGAMAVKMYAWSIIEAGGKWSDADVYDCNWDQVYKPSWRTDATDQAVEDTWNLALVHKNPGDLIRTYYDNWYSTCLSRGETSCLGQWNSKYRAEEGMTFDKILTMYYENSMVVNVDEGYTPQQVVEEKPVGEEYYTVKAGDTLSSIAYKFYGESTPELWNGIFEANTNILSSPNLINVGMELFIPAN